MFRFLNLVMLAFLVTGSLARADYMFEIDGPLNFSAGQAGSSVSRTLYLSATGGDSLQSATNARFDLSAGAGGSTLTAYSVHPDFGGILGGGAGNSVTPIAGGFRVFQTTQGANVANASANRVNLGTVQFTLGSAGSITPFNFTDAGAGSDVNAHFNGNAALAGLDARVFPGVQSISVAAVPEPGSASLLALLGCVALRVRRRKS